jgi:hypothetical protein
MNVDLETLSAVRVYKLTGNNRKEQLKVVSRLLGIYDRHVTTIKNESNMICLPLLRNLQPVFPQLDLQNHSTFTPTVTTRKINNPSKPA